MSLFAKPVLLGIVSATPVTVMICGADDTQRGAAAWHEQSIVIPA